MSQQTEWSAIVNTTIADYSKGATDLTLRDRPVYRTIMDRRGVKVEQDGGTELRWQAKMSLPDVRTYTGGPMNYEPSDRYRQAWVDWRGYYASDSISEKERFMNSGEPALINRVKELAKGVFQALDDQFQTEMYQDGLTDTKRFNGIPAVFDSTPTCGTGDIVAIPTAHTYGGLSTVLGNQGGAWTANLSTKPNATLARDWPDGSGDPEYDHWTPKMFNISSTGWGTSATDWLSNCERVLRKAILCCTLLGGSGGRPDMAVLCPSHYYDFGNRQASKQEILIPARNDLEVSFEGYRFEGIKLLTEFGVPGNTTFLLNTRQMFLHLLGGKLYHSSGLTWEERSAAWLMSARTYGNWRFTSPCFFAKLYPYA